MSSMTPDALRRAGLKALRRDLGVAGMVRFLQQFETGTGDYTAERLNWLERDVDIQTLEEIIQDSDSGPTLPEP